VGTISVLSLSLSHKERRKETNNQSPPLSEKKKCVNKYIFEMAHLLFFSRSPTPSSLSFSTFFQISSKPFHTLGISSSPTSPIGAPNRRPGHHLMLSNPISSSADFDILSTTGTPFKSLILGCMVLGFCLVTEKKEGRVGECVCFEDKVFLSENSTTMLAFLH
jgi:hypothetical protein